MMLRRKVWRPLISIMFVFLLMWLVGCAAESQVRQAEKGVRAAHAVHADILAPYEFFSAEAYYQEALNQLHESDFQAAGNFAVKSKAMSGEAERIARTKHAKPMIPWSMRQEGGYAPIGEAGTMPAPPSTEELLAPPPPAPAVPPTTKPVTPTTPTAPVTPPAPVTPAPAPTTPVTPVTPAAPPKAATPPPPPPKPTPPPPKVSDEYPLGEPVDLPPLDEDYLNELPPLDEITPIPEEDTEEEDSGSESDSEEPLDEGSDLEGDSE